MCIDAQHCSLLNGTPMYCTVRAQCALWSTAEIKKRVICISSLLPLCWLICHEWSWIKWKSNNVNREHGHSLRYNTPCMLYIDWTLSKNSLIPPLSRMFFATFKDSCGLWNMKISYLLIYLDVTPLPFLSCA